MPKFSFGGLIAGAGKGLTDVGKSMVTTGAALNLEQQREAAQALRDERLQSFLTSYRIAGEKAKSTESALERASKERMRRETLAAQERVTAVSLLKNATDALKMAKVDYATDPSNPQYITALKSAEKDYQDALSMARSRLGTALGGKAEAPKPAAGNSEGRDWRAFAPGAKADTPKAPETPAIAPPEATGEAATPEAGTGSVNEVQGPSSGIFSRAAGTVGGLINRVRDASYRPGVADSSSGKQDIRPGMTVNAGGKSLTAMTYLRDSKNGPVWRVKDDAGKMYEYVAPLK